jgi:hypothetical protein
MKTKKTSKTTKVLLSIIVAAAMIGIPASILMADAADPVFTVITTDPSPAQIDVGETVQVTATVTDGDGDAIVACDIILWGPGDTKPDWSASTPMTQLGPATFQIDLTGFATAGPWRYEMNASNDPTAYTGTNCTRIQENISLMCSHW